MQGGRGRTSGRALERHSYADTSEPGHSSFATHNIGKNRRPAPGPPPWYVRVMRARTAATIGVALAVAVGAIAFARRHGSRRGARGGHDDSGAGRSSRPRRLAGEEGHRFAIRLTSVASRRRSVSIRLRAAECPADYADADVGIVLSGSDVYARRNVYVFGLLGDAGTGTSTSVVSVTSAGCRLGPPADLATMRRELAAAGVLD